MIHRVRCQGRTVGSSCGSLWLVLVATAALLVTPASARTSGNSPGSGSPEAVIPAVDSQNQYTWIEAYDGSTNTNGLVTALDSSVGYTLGPHSFVGVGIPAYFVRTTTTTSTGTSTTNSFTALGDFYALVRLSFPNPAVNFKTQLTGTAPTGNTSDGVSTGHATYDWTNRLDRAIGQWTPFFEAGLANSIPNTFIYRRPFASFGTLAHFQAGTEYQIVDWLGVAASGFDIAPWGSQTLDGRVVGNGAGGPGAHPSGHGQKVTGGSSLTADNGFATEADFSPGNKVDFTLGYSRSTQYRLNTFSFGVTVNMRGAVRRSRSGL